MGLEVGPQHKAGGARVANCGAAQALQVGGLRWVEDLLKTDIKTDLWVF